MRSPFLQDFRSGVVLALVAIILSCVLCEFGASSTTQTAGSSQIGHSFTDGKETITLFYKKGRTSRPVRDTGSVVGGVAPVLGCANSLAPPTSAAILVDSSTMRYVRGVCTEGKRRRKRDIYALYPGTNYCGRGNRANGYDDLGQHRETDRCCRDHDYCRPEIPAFGWRGWTFNPVPYTMKSCDCDRKFRDCLTRVNTATSFTIYVSFFYVLGTQCFNP